MPMSDAVHNYLLEQVGDEDLLQDIYAEFLTSFRTGLDAFRAAMGDQDQDRMRRTAHTLKGNASIVGETAMKQLAIDMENGVIAQNRDAYQNALVQLEEAFQKCL
ncbi:MAG: Hpt domain-containing protein [Oligosphaeraceae bacterium]